jgi:outer membrane lipoprotein-sorting protein
MAAGQDLNAILGGMDAASTTFRGVAANLQMTTYTAVIDEKTVENGTLQMQRKKDGEVRAIIDFAAQKGAREIGFLGSNIRIYYPNLNTYQDYEIGKNASVLNQFLLLGFGSSGKDLAQNYTITVAGQQQIEGRDATELSLVPKDPQVKEKLSKVEMWIPVNSAYPIQQQFFEPSGNYRIVTYSNEKINPPIKRALELKLAPGAKKQS